MDFYRYLADLIMKYAKCNPMNTYFYNMSKVMLYFNS